MKLEGTDTSPDVPEGKIVLTVKNTTAQELARIQNIIHVMLEQGVFNLRTGSATMHFGEDGWIRSVSYQATKWHVENKAIPLRVAQFEQAIVEILNS